MMSQNIQKQTIIYLIIILFSSCAHFHNKAQLTKISAIEELTEADKQNLENFQSDEIKKILNIARFNLEIIEKKKLDSIAFSLIYYEYRNYIDCINTIYETYQKIEAMSNTLVINYTQIQNIKIDYINSNIKRDDLDGYLKEEISITKETSQSIKKLFRIIDSTTYNFYHLNKKIEDVIN